MRITLKSIVLAAALVLACSHAIAEQETYKQETY